GRPGSISTRPCGRPWPRHGPSAGSRSHLTAWRNSGTEPGSITSPATAGQGQAGLEEVLDGWVDRPLAIVGQAGPSHASSVLGWQASEPSGNPFAQAARPLAIEMGGVDEQRRTVPRMTAVED